MIKTEGNSVWNREARERYTWRLDVGGYILQRKDNVLDEPLVGSLKILTRDHADVGLSWYVGTKLKVEIVH